MISAGDRIGVIAGSGHLPFHIAHYLSGAGYNVYVAGLKGAADPALDCPEWETGWYNTYSLQELLDGLGQARVAKVVLAGRVGHEEIFSTRKFDGLLAAFLGNLKDHRPSTILGGLVDLLTGNGFEVLRLTEVAPDLLPEAGWLAGPPVQLRQVPDIESGWRIARAIANLDIGQTVILKGGAVVAVEAMEGTDRTIERAGVISGGGVTVVKLAAGDQDLRYDIPTVGSETISRLAEAGGNLLVVEAGRCFLLDLGRISALCEEKGITLLAGTDTGDGGVHWPEA
ncbi:UDP-2,3-diacylglucosamine diphosphatase LpxI [bacterium]|nr:UDP-2,3-diacylglucosamine diphosphatase LpxI [bacterium]